MKCAISLTWTPPARENTWWARDHYVSSEAIAIDDGAVPDGALTDENGNILTDENGNILTA